MAKRRLPVISLFSGALGLDLGLERAGFDVRVAVEMDKYAAQTIRRNRPDLPVIERPIEDVTTDEILEAAGLDVGEAVAVTGGPSCKPFSTAGRRESVEDPRGSLFLEFCRVVREARPEFYVMENVRGILSAAVRHRPLRERGPGFPPLEPDEELGSALVLVVQELAELGYFTVFDLLNAADFGVPQSRERVLFLGCGRGAPLALPAPSHSRHGEDGRETWRTLEDALAGLKEESPAFTPPSERNARFLKLVPEGGNWRDLPEDLQEEALGGAFRSWGGRSGFFRRLARTRTPPALTSRPDSRATMFCHPTELRPLSVREYARIQQFPDDWEFEGGRTHQYLQIGNAFPVGLGEAVGAALLSARRRRKVRAERLGRVACASAGLLKRLTRGHATRLNPPSMRAIKDLSSAKAWMKKSRSFTVRDMLRESVVALDELFAEEAA